jgi:hypothetical protein
MSKVDDVLRSLLEIDLSINARKLRLVEGGLVKMPETGLLSECIAVLNELSVNRDELSRKQLIAIAALLWTYRLPEWTGLRSCLVLFLSRAGFGPTSIMLDSGYSHDTRSYSYSESLQNKLAVTLAHANNEIMVGSRTLLVTDFQKSVWNGIDGKQLIGISAPTSAGKSYLILMKSMQLLLQREGIIVYIVPTLSLVNQVLADYRKALDEFGMEQYYLHASFNQGILTPRSIYVLTQERAIAAFSQDIVPFQALRLLVIDEVQNVERVESVEDQRAKVLYDLMMEFRNYATIDHIIISGPRIVKIDELGSAVFGTDAVKSETEASPVLNLTYSISKKRDTYHLSLVSDLLQRPLEVKITRYEQIAGYGKVLYQEPYLDYLDELVKAFGEECVLLFTPTPDASSKVAIHLAQNSVSQQTVYLNDLADFIANTVHSRYSLVETIRSGVAYHHGKLPTHVRMLIEDAIKTGKIKTIACTSTLLQGVNLPVQNIIIRNPNLFVTKRFHDTKLTNYELANLRGRAGRLLKDFIGRTFLLDESQFKETDSSQLDLFKDSAKELKVGYGGAYREHKSSIRNDIREQVGKTNNNQDYSYLTTYLRQAALRHGLNTQTYLSRVGINLSDRELNEVLASVNELELDRDICTRNRYWDPVDLNALQKKAGGLDLPTNPSNEGIAYGLESALIFLGREFPIYYDRYFGIRDNGTYRTLLQKCFMAEKWLKEKTLAEILSDPYYTDSDKIDDAVESLERTISYKMVLMLKPLYDIVHPRNMFPRYIELGAFRPLTRRFIELNIPRETAIYLSNPRGRFARMDPDDRQGLIREIRNVRSQLPIWYQIQLATI